MKRKAFTLIELLVVISIIAVLMSIMMPALGRAREAAKRVQCAANKKNLYTAMGMYATDWNDKINNPTRGRLNGWAEADGGRPDYQSRRWYQRYLTYADNPQILQCPSFRKGEIDESKISLTKFSGLPGTQYAGQQFVLNYTGMVYAFVGLELDHKGRPTRSDGKYYDTNYGGKEWRFSELRRFAARDDWRGILIADGIYEINDSGTWRPHNIAVKERKIQPGDTGYRGWYPHAGKANFLVADGSIGYAEENFVWGLPGHGDPRAADGKGLVPSMLK